jgi:hypothetical protein
MLNKSPTSWGFFSSHTVSSYPTSQEAAPSAQLAKIPNDKKHMDQSRHERNNRVRTIHHFPAT